MSEVKSKCVDPILESNRYQSDPKTKEEFKKFLKWIRENKGEDDLEKTVDAYLHDSDIAVYNLRVLHGANSRNSRKELAIGLMAAFLGAGLSLLLIHFLS